MYIGHSVFDDCDFFVNIYLQIIISISPTKSGTGISNAVLILDAMLYTV